MDTIAALNQSLNIAHRMLADLAKRLAILEAKQKKDREGTEAVASLLQMAAYDLGAHDSRISHLEREVKTGGNK